MAEPPAVAAATTAPQPPPPPAQPQQQQQQQQQWQNDFVVLAEFSEQLGPVALWVVPSPSSPDSAAAPAEGFEMQKWLSAMMAVDYQSRNGALAAFAEDTRVVAADPAAELQYYAHHFTLLDVHARGYVRPLLFAYVTRDASLILTHFDAFSALFAQITLALKRANRDITAADLACRIADLRFTESILAAEDADAMIAQHFPGGPPKYRLHSLRDHLSDIEQLQQRLGELPAPAVPAVPEELFVHATASPVQADAVESRSPTPVLSVHKGQFDQPLRGIDGLCGAQVTSVARKLVDRVLARFSRQKAVRELAEMAELDAGCEPQAMQLAMGPVRLNFCIDLPRDIRVNGDLPPGFSAQSQRSSSIRLQQRSSLSSPPPQPSVTPPPPPPLASPAPASPTDSAVSPAEPAAPVPTQAQQDASASPRDSTSPVADHATTPRALLPITISTPQPDPVPCNPLFNADPERLENLWVRLQPQPDTLRADGSSRALSLRGFVARFDFAKHIVYSLLRGRPVIIRAVPANQEPASSIVRVLSTFVAGRSDAVELWRTKTLLMADLARLRLVAVSARVLLPKAVERSATIFLLDEAHGSSLLGPACPNGSHIVEDLLAVRRTWLDDESYLAHVHEVLCSVALKAFLFYHLCCAGVCSLFPPLPDAVAAASAHRSRSLQQQQQQHQQLQRDTKRSPRERKSLLRIGVDSSLLRHSSPHVPQSPTSSSSPASTSQSQPADAIATAMAAASMAEQPLYSVIPVKQDLRESTRAKFFSELGIAPGDREIIEHIAEVVKLQQALEFASCTQVPPVKIDRALPCQLFKTAASHEPVVVAAAASDE